MHQYIEVEENTTEEALEAALKELGVSRDQVSVKVLHEPTKGILGLGAKLAKIRVTLKEDISSTPEAVLHEILSHMGLEAEIESQIINGSVHLTVSSDNPGILIGKHGQTLNAVEYLLNCILNRSSLVKKKVFVDAEGYRERREQMLTDLAYRAAAKVKQTHQEIVLDPMPPRDRRIIHVTLQSDEHIRTYSRGEGMMRRVAVTTRERYESNSKQYD
ncbi:protein jag [Candidatus Poribacteria bacterium]|nr:MAG: protein jag [Candidatus Poribacteria bacterium]